MWSCVAAGRIVVELPLVVAPGPRLPGRVLSLTTDLMPGFAVSNVLPEFGTGQPRSRTLAVPLPAALWVEKDSPSPCAECMVATASVAARTVSRTCIGFLAWVKPPRLDHTAVGGNAAVSQGTSRLGGESDTKSKNSCWNR